MKYTLYDITSIYTPQTIEITAPSPLKAVQMLYTDIKRDYTEKGNIVVVGNRGTYVYFARRKEQ